MVCGAYGINAQPKGPEADQQKAEQLKRAVALAQHGGANQAMTIVERLLAEDEQYGPAIKLKGMLLEEGGREEEAAAAYEQALRLAPNDPDLLLKVGVYKLQVRQWANAIELLEHGARLMPKDGDMQFYLAQAYHLNGQDDRALRAIRASSILEPDNAAVQQKYGELSCSSGDYAGGLTRLIRARRIDAQLPGIDYDIGWAQYNLMDLAHAVDSARLAIDKQPNDENAWRLLALAEVKLQQWQQAKEAFEKVLEFRPGDAELLQWLGQCDLELKNYPGAERSLNAALRADPTLLLAHFYLARVYAAMGRQADSQRETSLHRMMMERLTFVRSLESEQRENAIRAPARELLSQHKEQAALKLYADHFKGTSATSADGYVFVGKLYLFMGDPENGLRCLRHALELQPAVRGAHTNIGLLALKNGELAKAESEFKAELANDPNAQTSMAELGEVWYHQGKWAEAAEQIEKSHTMTPELLYLMSDAYFRMGKVQEANLAAELVAAYGRQNALLMNELMQCLRQHGQTETMQRLSEIVSP
jgi:tetratricopeptide (TPR) repeat protein